jgi:hypothetical protein
MILGKKVFFMLGMGPIFFPKITVGTSLKQLNLFNTIYPANVLFDQSE